MTTRKSVATQLKSTASFLLLALVIHCVTCSGSLTEDATSSAPNNAVPSLANPAQTAPLIPAAPVAPAATTTSTTVGGTELHLLTFYMHDILGGSNPSARAVTGIVANPALSAQVPFAKPNSANLPINNGIPQNSANNELINNNNVPFLTGLSRNTGNVIQDNGINLINGGARFPVLNGGQLPQGTTLQKLMFGTLTVFDNELTEGHELGSGLMGKVQGFYIASSEDGNSQIIALTAMFKGGGYVDGLSFFGVHWTAVSELQLAIMGGTGKYVNARGYTTVKTFPAPPNQQITDGMETLLEFTVYLA